MSEEKPDVVTVEIPKAMADHIQQHPNFKLFRDFDDFVVSAVRDMMERYMPKVPKRQ